jgi:dienelactone hydrolase
MSSSSTESSPGLFNVGPCCLKPGHVVVGEAKGSIVSVAGVECYRAGTNTERAVLYSADVFGLRFENHKVVADTIAAGGFTVLVPDYLHDALDPSKPFDFAKFPEWVSRNTCEAGAAILEKVAQQLHSDGFKSISVIGYCYGSKTAFLLQLKSPLIKAAVYSHPSLLNVGDGAKLPKGTHLLVNCAEKDSIYTPELQDDFEKGAKHAGVHLQVIYYPRTVHGFSCRITDADKEKGQRDIDAATVNIIKFLQLNA